MQYMCRTVNVGILLIDFSLPIFTILVPFPWMNLIDFLFWMNKTNVNTFNKRWKSLKLYIEWSLFQSFQSYFWSWNCKILSKCWPFFVQKNSCYIHFLWIVNELKLYCKHIKFEVNDTINDILLYEFYWRMPFYF